MKQRIFSLTTNDGLSSIIFDLDNLDQRRHLVDHIHMNVLQTHKIWFEINGKNRQMFDYVSLDEAIYKSSFNDGILIDFEFYTGPEDYRKTVVKVSEHQFYRSK